MTYGRTPKKNRKILEIPKGFVYLLFRVGKRRVKLRVGRKAGSVRRDVNQEPGAYPPFFRSQHAFKNSSCSGVQRALFKLGTTVRPRLNGVPPARISLGASVVA